MFLAIYAFEDAKRPNVKRLGLLISTQTVQDPGQRGNVGRHIDVIRAERPFPDFHRAAGQWLTAGVITARVFQTAKVMVNGGGLGMLRTESFPGDRKGAPIDLVSFIEPAHIFVEDG